MTMDRFAALRQMKQRALGAFQANDLESANRLLDEVCRTAPGDVQAWLLRAAVYGQGGQFERTIACCNRVLALEPHSGQGYFYLGGAYGSLGQYDEAVSAYRQAVELVPGDPVIRCSFGAALSFAGHAEDSVPQYQEALRLRPRYGEAHCGLAHALAILARYNEAKIHYQQAVAINPRLVDAYSKLGDLLNATGMPHEGEAYYRQGLEHHPEAMELYCGLANSLRQQGRLTEALAVFEGARTIRSDDPALLCGEADIHERLGDYQAAYERLRSLIDRGALDANGADVFLRICRRYECCEEAITLAEGLLADDSLNPAMRRTLCHSLGKVLDRRGEYEAAFARFAEANRLVNVSYDAASNAERVDDLIAAFCRETLSNMPRATRISERPIFIVGMPRSGTSLVEQILASHPEVFGAGELNDITAMVRSLPVTLYPQCMEAIEQERVDQMAQEYLDHLARLAPDAARVTDKMPGNFFHLGLIAILFPAARVIHCARDPRDTSLSIFFQAFNVAHSYATDLGHIGAYYRQYRRLIAHWKSVLDIPILDVRYAELIAEPERVSREMVAFSGLPWDDRCLQFHDTERAVATASYDQVRRPIYTSSLGRWRHYEKHLRPLIEALGDALEQGA